MSVQALSWVLENSEARLGARLVLIAIANEADRLGEKCFASVTTLAAAAKMSERQTRTTLRALEKLGEIEHAGLSRFGTNIYRLPGMAQDRLLVEAGANLAGAESAPGQNPTEGGAESDRGVSDSAPDPQSTTNPRSLSVARPDVEGLCSLLANLIEANGVKRPTVTERWRAEMRRLVDRDGYDAGTVEAVIRWATADHFWRPNILSAPKLREKFPTLLLRMREKPRRGTEHTLDRLARDLVEEVNDGGQRNGQGSGPAAVGALPRVASR